MSTLLRYPLDLTGEAVSNRVVNEEYGIGLSRNRIFIPNGGPFYGNKTILVDLESGRELVPRTDYNLLHYYKEASDRTDKPVYAGVQITNSSVSTRIGFTSNHTGGEFSYVYYAIVEALKELELDDRPITWGDLIGVPAAMVPLPHLQPTRTLYGWKGVIDALMLLEKAIREGDTASRSLLIQTLDAKIAELDSYLGFADADFEQIREEIAQINQNLSTVVQVVNTKIGFTPYDPQDPEFDTIEGGKKYYIRANYGIVLPVLADLEMLETVTFSKLHTAIPTYFVANPQLEQMRFKTKTDTSIDHDVSNMVIFMKTSENEWSVFI